jgi:hypothetical protein
MSSLDNAIQSLAYHALATKYDATHTIKAAPVTPPESGGLSQPCAIAYFNGGYINMIDSTALKFFASFAVDFHFNMDRLKTAYEQMDTVIPDFAKRITGDPWLLGSGSTKIVDTIKVDEITIDQPTSFDWGGTGNTRLITLMVRFNIPVKYIETPTT